MTTTDRLLIHLIRAMHTHIAVSLIGVGKACETDKEGLETVHHYTSIAKVEHVEFETFVEHIQ